MLFRAVNVLLIICTIVGSTYECKHDWDDCEISKFCYLLRWQDNNCGVCTCGSTDGSCYKICHSGTNYNEYDYPDYDTRDLTYMDDDKLCFCDQTCTWYRDCCDDFGEFCTSEYTYSPTSEPTYSPTSEPTYWTKPSMKPTSTPTLFPTFQWSQGKRSYVTPFLMAFEEPLTQSELEALAPVICSYCFALPRDRCAYAGTELSKTYLYKITTYSMEAFAVMFSTSLYTDWVIARANYGMEMEKDALGFSEPPTLSFVVFGKTVLVDEEGNESYCVMIITILGVCTCILVCVVALLMMMRNRNKRVNTVYGGMEMQPPAIKEDMVGVVTTGEKEGKLMWESETREV